MENNQSNINKPPTYSNTQDALEHINERNNGILSSGTKGKEYPVGKLQQRIEDFKSGRKGICNVPKGNEVALRDSLLREISDGDLPNLNLFPINLGDQELDMEGLENVSVGITVDQTEDNIRGPQKYVSEVRLYRGYGVQKNPPKDTPDVEEGLLVDEVKAFLRICKANLEAHRLSNNGDKELDHLTPKVVIITPDPDHLGDKDKNIRTNMKNTGVGDIRHLLEKGVIH